MICTLFPPWLSPAIEILWISGGEVKLSLFTWSCGTPTGSLIQQNTQSVSLCEAGRGSGVGGGGRRWEHKTSLHLGPLRPSFAWSWHRAPQTAGKGSARPRNDKRDKQELDTGPKIRLVATNRRALWMTLLPTYCNTWGYGSLLHMCDCCDLFLSNISPRNLLWFAQEIWFSILATSTLLCFRSNIPHC